MAGRSLLVFPPFSCPCTSCLVIHFHPRARLAFWWRQQANPCVFLRRSSDCFAWFGGQTASCSDCFHLTLLVTTLSESTAA
jgi:hypothetical protein